MKIKIKHLIKINQKIVNKNDVMVKNKIQIKR